MATPIRPTQAYLITIEAPHRFGGYETTRLAFQSKPTVEDIQAAFAQYSAYYTDHGDTNHLVREALQELARDDVVDSRGAIRPDMTLTGWFRPLLGRGCSVRMSQLDWFPTSPTWTLPITDTLSWQVVAVDDRTSSS